MFSFVSVGIPRDKDHYYVPDESQVSELRSGHHVMLLKRSFSKN
jgi:hypothetical protein